MRVFTVNRKEFHFTGEFNYQDAEPSFKPESKMVIDGCFIFTKKGQLLDWVSEWLTDSMDNNSRNDNTAREYAKVVASFLEFLIDREHRFKSPKPTQAPDIQELLLDVNGSIVLEYLNAHCKSLSNGVKSFRDVVLKQFYEEYICSSHYGENNGIALLDEAYNPFRDFSSEEGTKKLFHGIAKINDEGGGGAISIDNLMELMVLAKDERERCLYQFMYDSGLRVGEIPLVMRADINDALQRFSSRLALDEEENGLIESRYKTLNVKGVKPRNRNDFKYRTTYVSTVTLDRLKRFFEDRFGFYKRHTRGISLEQQHAFLNAQGNPISKQSLSSLIKTRFEEGKRIGLFQDRSEPITPHKFRHGFAVACLTSPDVRPDPHERMVALSKWLGHNSVKTTEKHYQSIAAELQHNLQTGELLNRCDLMMEVYRKTKPTEIKNTIKQRVGNIKS